MVAPPLVWKDGDFKDADYTWRRIETHESEAGEMFLRPGLKEKTIKEIISDYEVGKHYFLSETSLVAWARANWENEVWKAKVDDVADNQVMHSMLLRVSSL
jgi:hypothetical protein